MKKGFFSPKHELELQKEPLSKEEVLEGNTLFLRFLNSTEPTSEEVELADFHLSYEKLIMVAIKIDTFGVNPGEAPIWINGKRFIYRHQVLHQILYFNFFYRATLVFVKFYFQWLAGQEKTTVA